MNISSPHLVDHPKEYPFDSLSKEYDLIMLIIKICIAIEYSYYEHSEKIDLLLISLNIGIIILSYSLFFQLVIINNCINLSMSLFYANPVHNQLRRLLIIFNFIYMSLGMYYFKYGNTIATILIIGIISLNITIVVISIQYYLFSENDSILQAISYENVLYMIIINKGDRSSKMYLKSIQDSILRKHKKDSNEKSLLTSSSCYLCQNYSDDIENNIIILYKYLNDLHYPKTFFEEIIKLFYFFIGKQSFKFIRYYYYLIYKYEKIDKNNLRNIRMLSEVWLKKNYDCNYELINALLIVNSLEKKMTSLIVNMDTFFNKNLKLKTPQTAIELSNELAEFNMKIKEEINKINILKSSFMLLDAHIRSINGVINYNIIILRYVLESLINQTLTSLMPLNTDNLEDLFLHHYINDQKCICSVDLSSTYNNEINIIKVTGKLIDQDKQLLLLSHYFPKEIRLELSMQFHCLINSIVSNELEAITYSFPFFHKEIIKYIQYSFYITRIPKSPILIIFGQYDEIQLKTVLIDTINPHLKILGFCRKILQLMHFKRKWLEYLKEIHMPFFLDEIFKIIEEDNSKIIKCEFNPSSFILNNPTIFKELRNSKEFQADKENEDYLQVTLLKMKQSIEITRITFEKIIEYSAGICLFNMKINNTTTKRSNNNNNNNNNSNYHLHKHSNADIEEDENMLDINVHSTAYSISSLSQDQSLLSIHNMKNPNSSEYNILNIELKSKIVIEEKKLSFFKIIMVLLNITLILICVVFLFTQISQTKEMSNLSLLYFNFKQIQWIIPNFFLSLVSTICFSKSETPTNYCVNAYQKYTEYYHETFGLPIEYNFLKYAMEDLKCKAEYVQETLNYFKTLLFSSRNAEFQSLFNDLMLFYDFQVISNKTFINKLQITFEEGIRHYINLILIITRDLSNEPYDTIPIYFIHFENNTFVFKNNIADTLSTVQKEIYKGIMNYINFFYSFTKGDKSLKSKFEKIGSLNNATNIVFMTTMALCNFILFILCKHNIDTAYHIFNVLIFNVILQTEDVEYAQYLKKKLKNLLILVKFYKKNPNDLIMKHNKIIATYQNQMRSHYYNNINSNKNSNELEVKKEHEHSIKLNHGNGLYQYLLRKVINILFIVFGIVFVIVITFDVLLVKEFNFVLDFFNFSWVNYSLDHALLSNLAIASLSYFGNMTSQDLALRMGINHTGEGIANQNVKVTLNYYTHLLGYLQLNSTKYPTPQSIVNYNCDEISLSFKEICSSKVSEILGHDYRIANSYICHSFDLLHIPNLNYLRSDISIRTHHLWNKYSKRDYQTLYYFSIDKELFDLYTLTLIIFRPMSKNYKDTILFPKMDENFSFYVTLVGLYLAVNICLEIVLFASVQWGITTKINKIQNNLYLLNNCVN